MNDFLVKASLNVMAIKTMYDFIDLWLKVHKTLINLTTK